jgi:hypothetical protein
MAKMLHGSLSEAAGRRRRRARLRAAALDRARVQHFIIHEEGEFEVEDEYARDWHIEVLKADDDKYTTTASHSIREIAEHEADIAHTAATSGLDIEKADYSASHQDHSESADALQRAIAVLKWQAYDRRQVASLVQVSSLATLSLIPKAAKRVFGTFVQSEPAVGLAV